MTQKRQRSFPNTYVIVFFIIIFAAVLTWFLPGGSFNRQTVTVNGIDRQVINPESFEFTGNAPQTWEIFSAIFNGFVDKADIIVFILLIGGAFWIMNQTKAIDMGIYSFLKFTKRLEHNRLLRSLGVDNLIIVMVMLMFSIFGAVFGMSEETIAFTIIFVPLAIKMGYDSIVGVSFCFVAAGLGFTGAILNPFTIGIAQGLSDLPLFSGIEYRFVCFVIINTIGIGYILLYANKIKKNPTRSSVYEEDAYWRQAASEEVEEINFQTPISAWIVFGIIEACLIVYAAIFPQSTIHVGNLSWTFPIMPILAGLFLLTSALSLLKTVQFFILNLLAFTIIFLIVGVMGYGWYVMEIATLFFVMGLASGLAMNYSLNEITKYFLDGVKDILSAALIVGLAGGIIIILKNGKVIDTLLYYVSSGMADWGRFTSVSMMYVIQTFINLFMPSGSAKAALTMPIMSQFSDLIQVSRQATVMAFQFGDGFTNMITPTSGVLMGVLGIARIPYSKWVKWVFPFILILFILGFLLLIPTVAMDLSGF